MAQSLLKGQVLRFLSAYYWFCLRHSLRAAYISLYVLHAVLPRLYSACPSVSLNHLVYCAVGFVEIFMCKIKCDVINTFSLLINNKFSVVSTLLYKVVFHVFSMQVNSHITWFFIKVKKITYEAVKHC